MSYLIKSRVYIFIVILSILFIAPFVVFGQGLVPCEGVNCTIDHLVELATRVVDWFVILIVPSLAGLAFMIAGFYYITSAGDPNRVQRAHEIFKYTFLGIVVALAAWLIIKTLLTTFGVGGGFNLFT